MQYKMSDTEEPEPLFEGIAENEVVEEPEKEPVKKKTKKVTKVKVEEEPLLPDIEDTVVEVKKPKKKRVISPEQKAKLLDNLARGRATSLAKRKKNAQLRKIAKEESEEAENEKIFQALKKKQRPKELETENAKLKEELAALKLSMSKPKEEKKVVPPQKLIEVRSRPTIIEDENKVVKPKPAEVAKPKKKELTKREIQKLMKGL